MSWRHDERRPMHPACISSWLFIYARNCSQIYLIQEQLILISRICSGIYDRWLCHISHRPTYGQGWHLWGHKNCHCGIHIFTGCTSLGVSKYLPHYFSCIYIILYTTLPKRQTSYKQLYQQLLSYTLLARNICVKYWSRFAQNVSLKAFVWNLF